MITRMRRLKWMFHNEGNNRHIRAWQRVRQKERADDKGRMFQPLLWRLTQSILKVRGRENEIDIARNREKKNSLGFYTTTWPDSWNQKSFKLDQQFKTAIQQQ